jgi:galactoside O-acetyltransferase
MKNNPFDPEYYTEKDLQNLGFKALGKNITIARNNTIVGIQNIEIGDNVRIDGYCAIIAAGNGWLKIGSYVHIGGWSYLSAGNGIELEDFSSISQGVRVYSRTDDYSGDSLTNPTIPEEFTGVTSGKVIVGKHVIIGSGTVILPKVHIHEGTSVGALSLVTKDLDPWGVYFGCPVRRLKERSKRLLELETKLMRKQETVK